MVNSFLELCKNYNDNIVYYCPMINTMCIYIFYLDGPFCESTGQQNLGTCILEYWLLMKLRYVMKWELKQKLFSFSILAKL